MIGATSVLVVLHQRGSATHDALAPRSTAAVAPPIAPRVQTGVSSSALRTLPTVKVQGLTAATTGLLAPRSTTAEIARPTTRMATALPTLPAKPPIAIAPTPTVFNGPPQALIYAVTTDPPASLASETAASSAADEFAVRRALNAYAAAYEALDVAAAAEIWPTVDRRALSRTFAALKTHRLEFTSCTITVHDATATAYCRGRLEYVRKVGNPVPLTAEQQWIFKMRRDGGVWKIDDVSTSQTTRSIAEAHR